MTYIIIIFSNKNAVICIQDNTQQVLAVMGVIFTLLLLLTIITYNCLKLIIIFAITLHAASI